MTLRIDVLGPMRGWSGDRELDLGPLRQRALLAVLAVRINQVISMDELLEAVWGDRLPDSGVKILPPYVYRVRRELGNPDCIRHSRDGYVLRLEPSAIDLHRFEAAASDARRAQAGDDLERASDLFARAMAEWRGEPLAGLPGPYLATLRHQLCERRRQAQTERLCLDLDRGRHAEIVPELVALVGENPTNEQLAGLKMLALFRSGRQAEALDTYTTARTALIEQLGVEPGSELRAVHQTVLGRPARPPRPPGRDDLPRDSVVFVGREAELGSIVDRLSGPGPMATPVVVIDGMAGVGKTALAVRAARRVADVYPDGRLFLDLHGHSPAQQPVPPAAALDRLLRSIGVPAEQIPADLTERSARWRAELADRRVLLVLDNAADSRQVEPLLPGGAGCGVLVTSRRQLSGLDLTHRIEIDTLAPDEATKLLAAMIGAERLAGEVAQARKVVAACGGLPLAVRIAAARLRHRHGWTIAELARRLTQPDSTVVELADDHGGVRQAFDVSYRRLPPDQQRQFRLLGPIPGPDIGPEAAAAAGAITPAEADRLLNALVDANLLLTPTPDRYTFHDLLHGYAMLEPAAGADTARHRVQSWYLHSAANAKMVIGAPLRISDLGEPAAGTVPATFAESAEALEWFDRERHNLFALVHDAVGRGEHRVACEIASVMVTYLTTRYLLDDLTALLRISTDSAERTGDKVAMATSALHVGMLSSRFLGDDAGALRHIEEAAELFRQAGHQLGRSVALSNLGNTLFNAGRAAEAIDHCRESMVIGRRIGDRVSEAASLNNVALASIELCRWDDAVEAGRQSLELLRDRGHHRGVPYALDTLGQALAGRGDHGEAIDHYELALGICDETGNRWLGCIVLAHLGHSQQASGQVAAARAGWQHALRIFDELDATDTNELRRSDLVQLLNRQG